MSDAERALVIATLASERYRDQPPGEVYHHLLERGEYLCSMSTMYRLLRERKASGERRAQRSAQHHAVPRLRAEAPNEVWTWDITKLPTLRRGVYLSLYVVLDLFSRLALAWMISAKENSALACQLMREASARYRIAPDTLTIHQDRGAPMIAHTYLDLMSELGITASHSRPRVSNDNPFSESAFKTQKYQPDYPGRFDDIVHANRWCGEYFPWYNLEHHHAGLAGFTPEQVYTGRYRPIAERKQRALDAQYARHPERFVRGRPSVPMPPTVVSINPIIETEEAQAPAGAVNFPTLTAAGAESKCTLSENQLSKTG
ncbi:transposase [mine drainage metagenome]|uniref:Transposase n=3 Tax=mine drainage metagenome TaxID=410659 RepID=T1C591_9ZZZZ